MRNFLLIGFLFGMLCNNCKKEDSTTNPNEVTLSLLQNNKWKISGDTSINILFKTDLVRIQYTTSINGGGRSTYYLNGKTLTLTEIAQKPYTSTYNNVRYSNDTIFGTVIKEVGLYVRVK